MDIIDLFIFAVFNSILTIAILIYFVRGAGERIIEAMQQGESGEVEHELVDAYIDFVDGKMYMYAKENNEFIAQGASWEELNKNTIARYPDTSFNVPTKDIEKAKEFK